MQKDESVVISQLAVTKQGVRDLNPLGPKKKRPTVTAPVPGPDSAPTAALATAIAAGS
jgi:hypothetical protein